MRIAAPLRLTLAAGATALLTSAGAFAANHHASSRRTLAIPPPSAFTASIDNVWFPLKPGSRYTYVGVKDGLPSRDIVTVSRQVRVISGVPCAVEHDRLYLRGQLRERTTDWYSQDSRGNVWYFGEKTAEFDTHGKVTSTEGTWIAGVDGAEPGIYMPAHPRVGESNRQEFYKGHAEDHFKVIGLFSTVAGTRWQERPAHRGMDTTRARNARPQALRPRHRHRPRTHRARGQRARRTRCDYPVEQSPTRWLPGFSRSDPCQV